MEVEYLWNSKGAGMRKAFKRRFPKTDAEFEHVIHRIFYFKKESTRCDSQIHADTH